MENLSAYELAQRRIEQRQRKQNRTVLWLILAAIGILYGFVLGQSAMTCVVPLTVIALIFAVLSGVEAYFASSRRRLPSPQVEQEMEWLFGDGWQDSVGVYEFSLALERIQKRRGAKVRFGMHLAFFLVANAAIFALASYNLSHFYTPGPLWVFILPIAWVFVLVSHALNAFPTQRWLMRRERQAGEAIQREIERMQPVKLKNEDKLKRGTYYTVGEDGELVEVDEEATGEEKAKRGSNG